MDLCCLQCVAQLGGFRCSQTTVHLQCLACWGIMPSRPDLRIPQNRIGCDGAFCGAYWQAKDLNSGDMLCGRETFRPIQTLPVLYIFCIFDFLTFCILGSTIHLMSAL